MNKKFLSAILFGALMVTSTGTFVSCKDYDDDINDLQEQIDANSTAIADLKTALDGANYVTDVTISGNNLVVTTKTGGSKTIALPECEGGTQAEVKNNELYLDGVATGIKVAEGEAVKIVDGEWAVLQKDGTYKSTGIKASNVTVTGNKKDGWVLTIDDQVIELPSAASSLTDLIVVTDHKTLSFADYEYEGAVDIADWKGPRTLPADEDDEVHIIASVTSPVVQINPTSVDGEEIEFKLVDSKNNYPANVSLTASPYTELISRAANANGLYSLSLNETVVAEEEDYEEFMAQFTKDNNSILYAVTAGGTVRSEYEVEVIEGTEATLSKIGVTDANGDYVATEKTGNNCVIYTGGNLGGSVSSPDIKVAANEWYDVIAVEDPAALYDMHLSVSNDDKTLFGVEIKEEVGSYQFRLTATPDNITKAGFKLSIETIAMNGEYKTAYLWIGQNSVIADGVTYDAIEHELKTVESDKNFFSISLDKMKNALGTEGLALWNKTATGVQVSYLDADDEVVVGATGVTPIFVTELKDKVSGNNGKTTTDYSKATNVVFNVTKTAATYFEVNEQYTAVITFTNAEDEELNTIKVPFTFTLPAITTLFEIDPGFVKENVVNLYLYADDYKKTNSNGAATFKLERVFKKYAADFDIALEGETNVGDTEKKSTELAQLSHTNGGYHNNVTIAENELAYLTLTGELGKEIGYGQVLNLIISGNFDGVWEYPEEEVFNFQAKVLSPIKEGKVTPKDGSVVTIKASDLNGFKFGNSLIVGQTYNSEVTYKVLQDVVGGWSRNDIQAVAAETGNKNYFTVKNTVNATKDAKGDTVEGYFLLEGYNVDHTVETTMAVKVTDIWNRTVESEVPVKITVAE